MVGICEKVIFFSANHYICFSRVFSQGNVSQENVEEVNKLIQSLAVNSEQMDFQVERSRAGWAPEGMAQIRELALELVSAIKVTGKTDKKVDVGKVGMGFFKWSNAAIYIDLKSSAPEKSIYVKSDYGIHSAEASKESIDRIIEFAKKNSILK